jgi:hypothetical protein
MTLALLFIAGISTAEAANAAGAGVTFSNGDALTKGMGARGIVQIGSGRTNIEAVASYAPDRGVENLTGLTHTLVAIPGREGSVSFQQPIELTSWSVAGLFDWSIVEPMRFSPTWVVSPHLLAGVGMAGVQGYYARYDEGSAAAGDPTPTVLEPTMRKVLLVAKAGASLEIWAQSKWGIRFATIDQMHFADKPQYDPNEPVNEGQIYHRVKTSIDFLVRFQ